MFDKIKLWWNGIKDWFSRSETIFLARFEAFVGFLVAVGAAFDWSPLLSLGFDTGINWKQAAFLGGLMFVKGVLVELARRRNAVDL